MLTFKGKGCDLCPFYHMFRDAWDKGDQWNECILHNFTDEMGESYPELYSVGGDRPEGCPFKDFPGNVEIQAQE